MQDKHMSSAYWSLRLALGVVPVVAGLDKFTNLLTDWEMYLSPRVASLLPVSPGTFMRAAGVIEVAVGAAILLGYARWFGWVASAWLVAIALNLLSTGHFLDVAARDVVMAAAAFSLAELARVQETARRSPASDAARPLHAHG